MQNENAYISTSELARQIKQADLEMRQRMGFGFSHVMDKFLTTEVCARPIIDIVAFDKKMIRVHGHYYENGLSMDDLLRQHYGDETLKFINSLLV